MPRPLLAALCSAALALPAFVPAVGQLLPPRRQQGAEEKIVLQVYTLRHQRASEAMMLVMPMLSPRGTVEIKPAENTLVIRDSVSSLGRMLPVLRKFDHPAQAIDLDLKMLQGARVSGEVPSSEGLDPVLLQQLRAWLPFPSYQLLARTEFTARENELVSYEVGDFYRVSFRLGTLHDGRLKITNFRFEKMASGNGELIYHDDDIDLRIRRPHVVVAQREAKSPRGLILALDSRLAAGSGERAAAPAPQ